jgi:hypothetical protein
MTGALRYSYPKRDLVLEQDREEKSRAVKAMIEMLNSHGSSKFHVMLFQYYIDTKAYSTSSFTVANDFTPNIRETEGGFECDAFFPPDMLRPEEREGKQLINGVTKVRLYVNLDDVVGIFRVAGGQTVALYPPTDD